MYTFGICYFSNGISTRHNFFPVGLSIKFFNHLQQNYKKVIESSDVILKPIAEKMRGKLDQYDIFVKGKLTVLGENLDSRFANDVLTDSDF